MKKYSIYLNSNQIENLSNLAKSIRKDFLNSYYDSDKAKEIQSFLSLLNQIEKQEK